MGRLFPCDFRLYQQSEIIIHVPILVSFSVNFYKIGISACVAPLNEFVKESEHCIFEPQVVLEIVYHDTISLCLISNLVKNSLGMFFWLTGKQVTSRIHCGLSLSWNHSHYIYFVGVHLMKGAGTMCPYALVAHHRYRIGTVDFAARLHMFPH